MRLLFPANLMVTKHIQSFPALAKGNIWDLGEPKILIRHNVKRWRQMTCHAHFVHKFIPTDMRLCIHTHTNTHPQTKQYFHLSQKISIMHRLSIYIAGRESCGMLHFEVCFIKAFPDIKCNDFIMNLNIKHLHLRTLVKREIELEQNVPYNRQNLICFIYTKCFFLWRCTEDQTF